MYTYKIILELPHHGERAGDSYLQLICYKQQYLCIPSIHYCPVNLCCTQYFGIVPATKTQCSGDCEPKSEDSLNDETNSKLTDFNRYSVQENMHLVMSMNFFAQPVVLSQAPHRAPSLATFINFSGTSEVGLSAYFIPNRRHGALKR